MWQKILCFIGYHEFVWRFEGMVKMQDGIPPHAECRHCDQVYGNKK